MHPWCAAMPVALRNSPRDSPREELSLFGKRSRIWQQYVTNGSTDWLCGSVILFPHECWEADFKHSENLIHLHTNFCFIFLIIWFSGWLTNQIDYCIVRKMFIEVVYLCLALNLYIKQSQNFKTRRELRDHLGQTIHIFDQKPGTDEVKRLPLVIKLWPDKAKTRAFASRL